MHKERKHNLTHSSEKLEAGWDALIAEGKRRIAEIQAAIEAFQKNKERGEPYFGERGPKTSGSKK